MARRRNPRKSPDHDRTGQTSASGPSAIAIGDVPGPAAIKLGAGARVHLDAQTDMATGIRLDGPAQLRGRFDHMPKPGGGSLYIRSMTVNPTVWPERAPDPTSNRAPAGRSMVAFTAGSKSCLCGFEAFRWQSKCPRCKRNI
jgi:hypothetical protein